MQRRQSISTALRINISPYFKEDAGESGQIRCKLFQVTQGRERQVQKPGNLALPLRQEHEPNAVVNVSFSK